MPSPLSSPLLKPTEIASGASRKRQRSESMHSDPSSSSPKRCVSESPSNDGGIRSPPPEDIQPPLSLDDDNDIDAYMAEQERTPDLGASALHHSIIPNGIGASPLPGGKLSLVKSLSSKQMQVGDTWYLVNRLWYKRWQKACSGEVDKEGVLEEKDVGHVNNSSLVDKDGQLRYGLIEGVDVEYVPQEVWSYFVAWYGEPIYPIPRKVIARGAVQIPMLEIYPPQVKALKLSEDPSSGAITGPPPHIITLSTADSIKTLFRHLTNAFPSHAGFPYRVWRIDVEDVEGSIYPSSKLLAHNGVLVRETDTSLEEAMIRTNDTFVVEFKRSAEWIAPTPSGDATSLIKFDAPQPLFGSGNDYLSQYSKASSTSKSKTTTGNTGIISQVMSKVASTSFVGTSGFISSSSRSKPLEPGTLGLGNMGNTCFMNSALQCLAHTKELAEYFLTGVYQDELNPDNPLGMGGAIAEAFGGLMQRIWSSESTSTSYSPREFKMQLQRFAPQFSGYQQHDSQELVAFLLDGLHEDLNRVLKKPYVEKPDWEGGGNMELISLARKSWEGYMKRNDSVIVDLFQGQYQSTLVCPECEKVSITFDPFMYLTLPLPVQRKWRHTILYVPWDSSKPHAKVPVEIGRDASFKDMRSLLGRWMGANPDNLLMLEIFSSRFYKYLDDRTQCADMADNDIIICYELPCHARNGRHAKRQPNDPFILPVLLCEPHQPFTSLAHGPVLFGHPTIVVIDKDQATNVDLIYDAVIERLERWTDHARDLYTWEGPTSSEDNDTLQDASVTQPSDDETEQNGMTPDGTTNPRSSITENQTEATDITLNGQPKKIGHKKGIFNLRLQSNHKDYGTSLPGYGYGSLAHRFVSWEHRADSPTNELLREHDALLCEFDENMKEYYFGDAHTRWEHARWNTWDQIIHPEYEAAKRATAERKNKGISLQDCLDEFTKEEQLGEDDLWYCPRCKKHQQATKKFDLWKAPDVLVVHLKRFSNNRIIRDKIDTFVDFPITGLDLEGRVGERRVAKELLSQEVDISELALSNPDDPLVYDLFGVDEHMGGLGGGHYRAYALNHLTGRWYHFDDSYVTPAQSTEAVNANAYLLFYRRRTSQSLGGTTAQKIEQARLQPSTLSPDSEPPAIDNQLPTPPDDTTSFTNGFNEREVYGPPRPSANDPWPISLSNNASNAGSIGSSPPQLDDIDLPNYDGHSLLDGNGSLNTLFLGSQHYDFPDPSSKASPTSSIEAEPDLDDDPDRDAWHAEGDHLFQDPSQETPYAGYSSGWSRPYSPVGSDMNPFVDGNDQIPITTGGDDTNIASASDDHVLHTPSP